MVRVRAAVLLRAVLELVVLGMACAAPWCYGAVHPGFTLLLLVGVGLVLTLWAGRMLLDGCLTWKKSPVALCLAGFFLIGIWQITPLPEPVLSWISPGTAELYSRLLPAQPEVLLGESGNSSATAGKTISLYPTATRDQLVRLLAVFLLFAAVRNNIASVAGLRRLAIVALLNGAALSVFALVQFFSSPHHLLYWKYPSLGQVFGPFICRNHFPFYVNLCIGLGIGLLLSRVYHRAPDMEGASSVRRTSPSKPAWWTAPLGLLQDPPALWIGAALALMTGAVAFSLSRGGLLALVGAGLACWFVKRSPSSPSSASGITLFVVALAILFAGWLGFGLIEERVATLWRGEALQSRLPLWTRMAPLAKQFPVWGTGWGTFSSTECLRQNTAEDARTGRTRPQRFPGGAPGNRPPRVGVGAARDRPGVSAWRSGGAPFRLSDSPGVGPGRPIWFYHPGPP